MKVKSLSRVRLFATPWTVAHEAPPSMEFSSQEYWSGFPFPSPGDLLDPGIEPRSPALHATVFFFFNLGALENLDVLEYSTHTEDKVYDRWGSGELDGRWGPHYPGSYEPD